MTLDLIAALITYFLKILLARLARAAISANRCLRSHCIHLSFVFTFSDCWETVIGMTQTAAKLNGSQLQDGSV